MKIDLQNISKYFLRATQEANHFYAVKELSLTFEQGKLYAIMGKSGSGKTTLLNMISGLLKPSSGKVLVDDQDLYTMEDYNLSHFRNQHFGIIPQGSTPIYSLNIMDNILLPALLYKPMTNEIKARGEELLKKVEISHLINAMPNELSGGELKRMSIARSLILNPEIILADEPTSDLDEQNTQNVLSILKDLTQNGTTVIMVTHDRDASDYADQVYNMKSGIITNEQI